MGARRAADIRAGFGLDEAPSRKTQEGGEMIRQTKSGKWECDHYYFDQQGKRRRKLRTFDTHRQAVAYAKESAAQVLKNEFVAPNRITVKDKAEAWFHAKFSNGNYARASRIERESHVHRYIVP